VVPASALSSALSGAQQAREAMRRRLYEPTVPWQTYVHSSMAAHTLQVSSRGPSCSRGPCCIHDPL
jgi:hypothetical protein